MTEPVTLLTPLPEGRKPRRDDEFLCVVESVDARGGALARWGEFRVRLRGGVPGARVRAQVVKRRRDRLDARVLELVEPSPHAVEPRCAHFSSCGGCSFQDVDYPVQLRLLRDLALRELAPVVADPEPLVAPVLGCDPPWGYRNKMDFTYSNRRWVEEGEADDRPRDFALGLHTRGRFDKVLDVARCEIQFEEANAILATASRLARERGLEPWDVLEHRGLLRHLVLRRGVHTGEVMVFLVVSREDEGARGYARAILERHPEITTLVLGVNGGRASVATAERQEVVRGPGVIVERLGALEFEVSPESFFQTNTRQAEVLLDVVREEARLGPEDVLLDLYCGAGAIGLSLARECREVVGLERVESAVTDAERNARRNGIENARFVAGEVERVWRADAELPAPTVVVVDPPRAGLHPDVVATLAESGPPRLVYVSCNLAAAARDLGPLLESGYALRAVRPVDLFPHTPHLEAVLSLERRP